MRKFLAFFLTFAILTSCLTVAFAESESEIPTEPEYGTEISVDDEVSDEGDQTVDETVDENTGDGEAENNDEIVATLYLCSNITVWPVVGHAWIYVENLSDEPIDVGYYNGVESGDGVSVGSFSFSVWDGWGIYYNLEAYRERNNNRYLYVSKDMNQADLDKLNNALKSYPNYWGIAGNCATFAFSMWNTVNGSAYFSLLIPAITHFTVLLMGGTSGEQIMSPVEEYEVKRQSGGQLVDIEYTNL